MYSSQIAALGFELRLKGALAEDRVSLRVVFIVFHFPVCWPELFHRKIFFGFCFGLKRSGQKMPSINNSFGQYLQFQFCAGL